MRTEEIHRFVHPNEIGNHLRVFGEPFKSIVDTTLTLDTHWEGLDRVGVEPTPGF